MENIKIKIHYRLDKDRGRVTFKVLYRPRPHDLIIGPKLSLSSTFGEHYEWDESEHRLKEFAVALASVNGRKNVCDTTADEGVLF